MTDVQPPGPLVRVWWDDIRDVESGWQTIAEINKHVTRCVSVGWLVHHDDESIVIVASVTDDHNVGSGLIIPVAAIIEWEDL